MLAPAKPSKLQQQMATNIEELAKQFQGFQSMMKQALDELSSINSWRGAVDESMGAMMLKQDATAARLLRLEHAPPPPPPPPFPPHPSGPGMQIDLNTAARASASTTDMFVGSGSPQDPLGEGGVSLDLFLTRAQVR